MHQWLESLNKNSTRRVYQLAVERFSKDISTTPEDLKSLPLEQIEDAMQQFITTRKTQLSPKYLNMLYCAVKDYCRYYKLIKSTAMFRQIKFDKMNRSTRDHAMITDEQFKSMFDAADLKEKCVAGLYGIHGVRPSLIPQIILRDVNASDLDMNTLTLKDKAWIWIWAKRNNMPVEGNKGNCDFPVILTKETSKWITQHLQERKRKGELITLKSKLVNINSERCVRYIIKKLYGAVGFKGRAYLMRHYADRLLRKATKDNQLKEWMMGHRGGIPEIYHHGHILSQDEMDEFKTMIDETPLLVYGISDREKDIAQRLAEQANTFGVSKQELLQALDALNTGKFTMTQFETSLSKMIKKTMEKEMERKFEAMFKVQMKKNGLS